MSDIVWKSFKVGSTEGAWEPASYNITWEDGREYGRWRRVLRQHRHGLTVISRYTAPPGKAWKIIGKASALGEEVYIMEETWPRHPLPQCGNNRILPSSRHSAPRL
jgi:hypothetical protein